MESVVKERCQGFLYLSYKDMCEKVSTTVRTQGGDTEDFPIKIGLHQGSTLNPNIFYHSYGCTYETHLRVGTKMHAFCS